MSKLYLDCLIQMKLNKTTIHIMHKFYDGVFLDWSTDFLESLLVAVSELHFWGVFCYQANFLLLSPDFLLNYANHLLELAS